MLKFRHSLLQALLVTTFVMHAAVAQQKPLLTKLAKEAAAASLVVGHRGASEKCPENTLAAFREAVANGAQIVEFDVYQTKDGAWWSCTMTPVIARRMPLPTLVARRCAWTN